MDAGERIRVILFESLVKVGLIFGAFLMARSTTVTEVAQGGVLCAVASLMWHWSLSERVTDLEDRVDRSEDTVPERTGDEDSH